MISKLSDENLLAHTKTKVGEEKILTLEILRHLAEIEKRKLYLKIGYPSLYEYCIDELGYSGGAAFRRISAMRLIKDVPEAADKILEGQVNVSSLSQLQRFIRKEEKFTGVKMQASEKRDLLSLVQNKSQQDVEREFARISPHIITSTEKLRAITDSLTEVKIVVHNDLLDKLEKIRHLTSHKNPNPSFVELLQILVDMALKKLDPTEKNLEKNTKKNIEKTSAKTKPENTAKARLRSQTPNYLPPFRRRETRYISSVLKQEVWMRSGGNCSYVDSGSGRRCCSKHFLQVDHVIPISRGGKTELKNLQLLCASHNQLKGDHLN